MRKQIIQYGNSLVLRFNKEEKKVYGLHKGAIVDVELKVIQDQIENEVKQNDG